MITTGFVRQYQGLVKAVVHEHEKDPQHFEDLVQDVWLRICRKASQLPEDEKAHSTWVQVLTERICADHVRSSRRGVELILDSTLTPPPDDLESVPEGSWIEQAVPSSETAEDDAMLAELMMRAASLSEQETAVFNLAYWHGKSYDDIAKTLGISKDTIGPIVNRLRAKLEKKEIYHKAYTYHAPGAVWGDWSWKPEGPANKAMENNNNVTTHSAREDWSSFRETV